MYHSLCLPPSSATSFSLESAAREALAKQPGVAETEPSIEEGGGRRRCLPRSQPEPAELGACKDGKNDCALPGEIMARGAEDDGTERASQKHDRGKAECDSVSKVTVNQHVRSKRSISDGTRSPHNSSWGSTEETLGSFRSFLKRSSVPTLGPRLITLQPYLTPDHAKLATLQRFLHSPGVQVRLPSAFDVTVMCG